ncbi:PEP-CTERM sorting domain-containing protein [Rubritalea marina]|uniref:PEP-CTERM sorting domain-containing protein n=1 Tax=Rubritalea marina TaxID=361055 RepID=UPI000369CD92|nr:PEP-CTERM sorting domain-containing protein [Rubritalea marina]
MKVKQQHSLLGAIALTMASTASLEAATVVWDGGASDGLWSSANNWDNDTVPTFGDTITISNGDTVTNDLGSGNLPFGSIITISGGSTLADTGVFRANHSTLNIEALSTLGSGGFHDLNGGTFNFTSGAIISASHWEHKGSNAFGFSLDSSGFTTINAGNLAFGNNGSGFATMADATYNVDMASYTGGVGTITLMQFANDAIDDADFQLATLNISNVGAGLNAALAYDDSGAIQLNVTAVPEPASTSLIGLGGFAFLLRRRR